VHVNNTNPALQPDGPERRQVAAAGWTIGQDGMEFRL
jgi:pyrroloquinoline quinone biosynthesis protein B